ncbi:MAG: hypothetical protein ACI9WU_003676, partial [Myxococcota bacterium]
RQASIKGRIRSVMAGSNALMRTPASVVYSGGLMWRIALSLFLLQGCSSDAVDPAPPAPDTAQPVALAAIEGISARWDDSDFFGKPWPSDQRMSGDALNFSAYPNPSDVPIVANLLGYATSIRGASQLPVIWFGFDGPLAARSEHDIVPASPDSPFVLLDIDDNRLIPVVARSLESDPYTPAPTLAMAPLPGWILRPGHRHVAAVLRHAKDAAGQPLGVSLAWRQRIADHDNITQSMTDAGIETAAIAAFTVFRTGDPVAALRDLSEAALAAHTTVIQGLAVDPDDGDHPRFCELHGTMELPQFQVGTPPFASDGHLELTSDGAPTVQRHETVPVVINLPKGEMPAAGYPLVVYFHGSGGISTQVVDRGTIPGPGMPPTKGEGPAHVLAAHGLATAGSAHPVSPERLEGAGDYEYLNFENMSVLSNPFAQGVIEQRLYIRALQSLEIPPEAAAGCSGLTLPAGATVFQFDAQQVGGMGQSMGGMYANMVAAVEPAITAVVPTGAGGFWSWQVLITTVIPIATILPALLQTDAELSWLHPAMHALQLGFTGAEPLLFMRRVAFDRLEGHPPRHVYQPLGLDDTNFPNPIFDAAVLAYHHAQTGSPAWTSTQPHLAAAGLDGLLPYPVAANATALDGATYTGAAVQYPGDGFTDPHYVFQQLDDIKHQYGCFFETWAQGSPAIVAPAPLGSPCL